MDPEHPAPAGGPASRHATRLLAAGAALGLAMAAFGLFETGGAGALPETAVARVNDTLIARDDYARLLSGLDRDTRAPVDDSMRRHVLDRMIDEELLVQRALELGLASADRRVRGNLTSALITSVIADAESEEPEPGELRSFHEENLELFSTPGRLRVRQIFVRERSGEGVAARERIERAASALSEGEAFPVVRDRHGDDPVAPLPDALLPPAKLREYVGPTVLRRTLELEPGERSGPVRSGTGWHLVELVAREPSSAPPFEGFERQVEAEWRRRAGERALRRYLDDLRDDASVIVTTDVP